MCWKQYTLHSINFEIYTWGKEHRYWQKGEKSKRKTNHSNIFEFYIFHINAKIFYYGCAFLLCCCCLQLCTLHVNCCLYFFLVVNMIFCFFFFFSFSIPSFFGLFCYPRKQIWHIFYMHRVCHCVIFLFA